VDWRNTIARRKDHAVFRGIHSPIVETRRRRRAEGRQNAEGSLVQTRRLAGCNKTTERAPTPGEREDT
jgi:hypothetical protein